MKDAIFKRLEAVEARCRKSHMIILAKDHMTGRVEEMSVHECIKRNAEFLRVICAGDLAELDMLFESVMNEAMKEGIPDVEG